MEAFMKASFRKLVSNSGESWCKNEGKRKSVCGMERVLAGGIFEMDLWICECLWRNNIHRY